MDIPLVVTEQKPSGTYAASHQPAFSSAHLYISTALGKTVKELDVSHASLNRDKMRFSMLVPEVRTWLEEQKIRSVVIFGIESHVCVLETVLDLLTLPSLTRGPEAGGVHILADAVSSCNAAEIPIALGRMRDAGACVTSSESALFQLLRDASHPNFRQVSELIKEYRDANQANPLWPSKI